MIWFFCSCLMWRRLMPITFCFKSEIISKFNEWELNKNVTMNINQLTKIYWNVVIVGLYTFIRKTGFFFVMYLLLSFCRIAYLRTMKHLVCVATLWTWKKKRLKSTVISPKCMQFKYSFFIIVCFFFIISAADFGIFNYFIDLIDSSWN